VAGKLYRLIRHHPVLTGTAVLVWWLWHLVGWPGPVFLANVIMTTAGVWWFLWPRSFTRLILRPAYGRWRRQHYHRHWPSVMTIGHLAPAYQGRLLLPVLGKVVSTRYTDRVSIRLVSGQSAEDYARRADNLAHGFGAVTCRVRTAKPGRLVLEFVRRDALAAIIAALPIPAVPDLGALPVGKREDGSTWTIRLHGTHVIIAGSTGAGKDSLVWCLVRAMLPAMKEGLARVLAADPKVMELAYGRAIFDTYGTYEAEPERIADMLEDAVAAMRERAGQLAGTQRSHTPSPEHPFVVIIVDEVAFLTAYHPSKDLRERIKAALATLTTQGRAVGYCVVAALQDPRKEVMSIRNLFPDRIAMRLDEPEQVDMVLGDGARDRGAAAELISTNPDIGAGVAYVRLESDPDPVRVRAAWVSDADITAMAAGCEPPAPPLRAAA
jgi:S-DNA-T family DNA segregation ATPase FtsK/SpoIIIE